MSQDREILKRCDEVRVQKRWCEFGEIFHIVGFGTSKEGYLSLEVNRNEEEYISLGTYDCKDDALTVLHFIGLKYQQDKSKVIVMPQTAEGIL